jgi:hypothetical protein
MGVVRDVSIQKVVLEARKCGALWRMYTYSRNSLLGHRAALKGLGSSQPREGDNVRFGCVHVGTMLRELE